MCKLTGYFQVVKFYGLLFDSEDLLLTPIDMAGNPRVDILLSKWVAVVYP